MNSNFLELMWQQAEVWRLLLAVFCGITVGIIYFYSMRWSINRLSETEHKFKLFGLTALARILLFFGVLVLIANRNVMVISLYVAAFFLTKLVIVWYEKAHLPASEDTKKE